MTTAEPAANRFLNVRLDELGTAMIALFQCAGIQGRTATYVSTPITSGEPLLGWHERRATGESSAQPSQTDVMAENRHRAGRLISLARSSFDGPVVEPVSLPAVPGWEQPDYHRFWCAFIERHAHVVVFNHDWHLSTGCAAEFATAVLSGAELLDHQLRPLTLIRGIQLLSHARERLGRAELPHAMFDDVIEAVEPPSASR